MDNHVFFGSVGDVLSKEWFLACYIFLMLWQTAVFSSPWNCLSNMEERRQKDWWHRWHKRYWENRLQGVPAASCSRKDWIYTGFVAIPTCCISGSSWFSDSHAAYSVATMSNNCSSQWKWNLLRILIFRANSFDVVISSLAFHYIQSFEDIVSRVSKCLSGDGDFVFSVEHPVFTAEGKTVEPKPADYLMNEPGMKDELRRPMMLLIAACKKWLNKGFRGHRYAGKG